MFEMFEIETPSGHKEMINIVLVESFVPYGTGCRINFASGRFTYSTSSYDELIRFIREETSDRDDG